MAETLISASVVAELRKETGAGMMDCKQALIEAGGDKDTALELLRKKGKAAADKRADRVAQEGVVVMKSSPDGKTAVLVELRSETDFVARNEEFRTFADEIADVVLQWNGAEAKSVDELKTQKLKNGTMIGDALTTLVGKIGEKLELARFAKVTVNGYVGSYIHSDNKLGVLVALEGASGDKDETRTLARDLAMQTAAASPIVVRRDEVPAEKIESEMRIEMERAVAEGKPEPAVKKVAEGRVNKWLATVVLLEQPFVKEPKQTINDVVAETEKKSGQKISVKSFIRFRIGE